MTTERIAELEAENAALQARIAVKDAALDKMLSVTRSLQAGKISPAALEEAESAGSAALDSDGSPAYDREPLAEGREHLTVSGTFQSDKYPTVPAGKVPLSVKDENAQDLLTIYANRRESIDPEFSRDLHEALENAGYVGDRVA